VCAALVATTLAVAVPAAAQVSTGTVVGVAVDSLRGGALAGALIAVEGAPLATPTGPDGSFVIDRVPVGTHRLELLHPVLDTIGLNVFSPSFAVVKGDTVALTVMLPAAARIIRAKCEPAQIADETAAFFGRILDGEGAGVAGANVLLSWIEVQIGREAGFRRIPQQRSIESGEDGRFSLCRLPTGISGDLSVQHAGDSVGPIPVAFGGSLLRFSAVVLPGGVTANLRGRVRNLEGNPVIGARVSLHGGRQSVTTDSAGRFQLESELAGTRILLVRRIGYQPAEMTVHLRPGMAEDADVRLGSFVALLDEIVVRRQTDAALERVGFGVRRRAGMGNYLDPGQIERSGAVDVFDLLRRFSNLRYVITSEGNRVIVGRPLGFDSEGCVNYFVDGQPWLGEGSPVPYMQPHEIAAMEVYSAAFTPQEFTRSLTICETIVIWTRFNLGIR
jgi:hypothetical protein